MAFQIKHFRWYIAVLLFSVTVVNYIDRQTLAVTAPVIKEEFKMSNSSYANILNAFTAAYMTSMLLSSRLIDKIGPKIGLPFCVGFWSVACMLHALARSVFSFGFYRGLLGLGEGGNWPGAVRVISEWFPPHEKAFAVGLFNGGTSIGALLAPPVVGYLTLRYGWRWAYVTVGAVGLVWLLGWLLLYERPEKNKWLTEQERAAIFAFRVPQDCVTSTTNKSFKPLDLLRYRQFWGFVSGLFFGNVNWTFMIFWLPNYLHEARSFGTREIALFVWIPFLAADLGALFGGAASGFLIKRAWTVNRARKTVMLVMGSLVVPTILTVNRVDHPASCIALISFAVFAWQSWSANLVTLPADVFPVHVTAFASGLGGFLSSVGSLAWNWYVGFVTDKFHAYGLVFGAAGVLMSLAVVSMLVVAGKLEPVAALRR